MGASPVMVEDRYPLAGIPLGTLLGRKGTQSNPTQINCGDLD